MIFRRRILAAASIALILGLTFAAIGQQSPLDGFDDYALKAMKDWEVPGMAVAVIKDDKVIFAKGYGVKKLGEPAPVDERTIFAIGSSSKAFTAAALAILVDEGKVKWDDPVSKYLPEFELFDPYVTRELRVRDLLTHRSGLERGDTLWYGTTNSREEILRRTRFLRPTWSFRSQFGYQNIMYLAAGQVVEKVSGITWDEFVKRKIFGPIGMTASGTSIKEFKPGENLAAPHAKMGDRVQPIAWRDIDNIAPAGSINSNVLEAAQWVRLQLGKGAVDGKKVFSTAVSTEMHVSQTAIRVEGTYPIRYPKAHLINYGMGWFLSDFKGRKLVDHGGAIDGMRAEIAMVPEENLGIVILTNLNGTEIAYPLVYRIIDAFLKEPQTDYSTDMIKAYKPIREQAAVAEKKAEAERVTGTRPSLDLAKYVGTYRSELYGDAKVSIEDGQLKVEFGPLVSKLEHWHFDTFRATFVTSGISKVPLVFTLSAQGKLDAVTFSIPGLAGYPFKRLDDHK